MGGGTGGGISGGTCPKTPTPEDPKVPEEAEAPGSIIGAAAFLQPLPHLFDGGRHPASLPGARSPEVAILQGRAKSAAVARAEGRSRGGPESRRPEAGVVERAWPKRRRRGKSCVYLDTHVYTSCACWYTHMSMYMHVSACISMYM